MTDDDSHFLLSTIDDDPELVRSWMSAYGAPNLTRYAVDLALSLPPKEAVPIFADAIAALLVKPKYGPLHKTPPRLMALGLSCIDSKDAAEVLAKYANSAIFGPMVLAYFRDHKDKGAALEATAKGKSKLETTAARVLGGKSNKAAISKTNEKVDGKVRSRISAFPRKTCSGVGTSGDLHGDTMTLVEKLGLKMLPGLLLPKRDWVAWLA